MEQLTPPGQGAVNEPCCRQITPFGVDCRTDGMDRDDGGGGEGSNDKTDSAGEG